MKKSPNIIHPCEEKDPKTGKIVLNPVNPEILGVITDYMFCHLGILLTLREDGDFVVCHRHY